MLTLVGFLLSLFCLTFAIEIEVSKSGMDNVNCSPCKTIVYAAGFGTGAASKDVSLTVGTGQYEETSEVSVNGSLKITGRNQAECFLSKPNNGAFALFKIVQKNSNLSFVNLTLLLTNHSDRYSIVFSNVSETSIIFRECKITQKEGLGKINGTSVMLWRDYFWMDKCSVYDINVDYDVFEAVYMNNVWFTDTSFTNMTGQYIFGFAQLEGSYNMSGCVSTNCTNRIIDLSGLCGSGHVIQSSVFLNVSLNTFVISIFSRVSNPSDITITNNSFVFRDSDLCTIIIGRYVTSHIFSCIFVNFTLNYSFGGAIYIENNATAYIQGCVFKNCLANIGGALFVSKANVVIIGCVFIGNKAKSGKGNDIYTEGANASITLVDTYTDQSSIALAFYVNSSKVTGALAVFCTNTDTRAAASSANGDANSGVSRVLYVVIVVLAAVVVVLTVAVFVLCRGRVKRRDEYSFNNHLGMRDQPDETLHRRQTELRGEAEQGKGDGV